MSLSKTEIQQIRQVILQQMNQLKQQLSLSQESSKTVELDQALAGRVSRIDAIQQQKVAQAGLNRARIKTERLNQALKALDSEDFGYCLECGEAIKFARLLIKPESVYCIDCQSRLE